jgi:hypothetical protein
VPRRFPFRNGDAHHLRACAAKAPRRRRLAPRRLRSRSGRAVALGRSVFRQLERGRGGGVLAALEGARGRLLCRSAGLPHTAVRHDARRGGAARATVAALRAASEGGSGRARRPSSPSSTATLRRLRDRLSRINPSSMPPTTSRWWRPLAPIGPSWRARTSSSRGWALAGPLALAPTLNPYGPGLARPTAGPAPALPSAIRGIGALFGAAYLLAAVTGVCPGEAVAPLHANGPTGLLDPVGSPYPLAFVHARSGERKGQHCCRRPAARGDGGLHGPKTGGATILHRQLTPAGAEVAGCPQRGG